ncbi:hypothetical protein MMC15_001923 [Xylographa vitiligo]|nr:hypothetical protein [Xylographa vitiligo]
MHATDWVVERLAELRSFGKHPEVWRLSKLQLSRLHLCVARAWSLGKADASKGSCKFLQAQELLGANGQPHQPKRSRDIREFVRFAYEIADGCEAWIKLITDWYSGLSLEDEEGEDEPVSEVGSESTSSAKS